MDKTEKAWMNIEVKTENYARVDYPADIKIYETDSIANGDSLHVSEYDAGGFCICENVPFQYDDSNELTFLLLGETPANTTRYYRLEIIRDRKSRRNYIEGAPLVEITDKNLFAHGWSSWKIKNREAEFVFDRCGGAFSEMTDKDGGDWIQYDFTDPPVCYRGIPNLQTYTSGIFHPGYGTVKSTIVAAGPLKIKIYAETNLKLREANTVNEDTDWGITYEIFPDFVRSIVLRGDNEGCAFLYEGVPGGKEFDKTKQYCMNSDKSKIYFTENITQNITPKWLYFGDDRINRVLYYAYLEEKSTHEKIYQVFDQLTVFGFGRETVPAIVDFPATFTFGFCESADFDTVAAKVNGAYRPLELMAGRFRSV